MYEYTKPCGSGSTGKYIIFEQEQASLILSLIHEKVHILLGCFSGPVLFSAICWVSPTGAVGASQLLTVLKV